MIKYNNKSLIVFLKLFLCCVLFFLFSASVTAIRGFWFVTKIYAADACGARCATTSCTGCSGKSVTVTRCGTTNCWDSAGHCVPPQSTGVSCSCNNGVFTADFQYACAAGQGQPPASDTTAPTCQTPTVSPGSPLSAGSIDLSGTGSDNVGIARTGVYIYQGSNWIATVRDNSKANTSSPLNVSWATNVPDGTYQVHMNWYDAANNGPTQCSTSFVIDKTQPSCGAFSFSPGSPSNANSVYVSSSATDNLSLWRSALYVSKNSNATPGNWQAIIPPYKSYNSGTTSGFVDGTVNFSTFGNGTYIFASNWWDTAGNAYKQCTYNYTINKTPPTATLSGATQVCLNTSQTYSLSASAVNGMKLAYFTYYRPAPTNSWKTDPFPLYTTGNLSGNSYSGSASITFSTANGFSAGNSYYVASGAEDDLGNKCNGSQLLFPTAPAAGTIVSGFYYCGNSSRQTVTIIDKPAASVVAPNLRQVYNSLDANWTIRLRWDQLSGDTASMYSVTQPANSQSWSTLSCSGTYCQQTFQISGGCSAEYTYSVVKTDSCGASTPKSITVSPNCYPSCSLGTTSSLPANPSSALTINSTNSPGVNDTGDSISSYNWYVDGQSVTGTLNSYNYSASSSYGKTQTIIQVVSDTFGSSNSKSCSLAVSTVEPTISVGPVSSVSFSRNSQYAYSAWGVAVSSTVLNDNPGTLTYNQSDNITYGASSYQNICKAPGVTCSFNSTSFVASKSIAGSNVSTWLNIRVPRALTPGTYAYGLDLSSTKWDNTAISSQSNNLFVVRNFLPLCGRPVLSEYSTYSSVGYPLNYSITASATSVSDLDGTIVSYTWDAPSVGDIAIADRSLNPTNYITSSSYNTTTAIAYTVTDSSGGTKKCTSEAIKTIIQPGVSASWANYAIDTNQNITDSKTITITETPTEAGFTVNMDLAIDTSSNQFYINSTTVNNICKVTDVTCEFLGSGLSVNDNVTSTAGSTSKDYTVKITVPQSIPVRNYGIRIGGTTTYLGETLTVNSGKTVFITAAPSTITVQCADGSTTSPCPTTYSSNRGWVSDAIAFNIVSSRFNGNFSVTEDVTSACGDTGVTCTFSTTAAGTYTDSLTNQSLATDATNIIYMKIATTNLSVPKAYLAKFTVVGTRNNVNTSTGNQSSPGTSFTLGNQNPICGTQTFTYSPASPIAKGGTTTLTVGGGSDPDSDPVTYGAWATSSGTITAASTNSATVTAVNTFNSCANISYKVYDNQTPQGVSVATCAVAGALCTIKDNVRPTATITTAASAVCKGDNYPVAFSYADADSNLTYVSIKKSAPVSVIAEKTGSFGTSTTLSGSTTFATAGTYTVYPTATDALGNSCDSSGTNTCGAGTSKTVIVNENADSPVLSYVVDPLSESKVTIKWTKPAGLSASSYALTGASGTIGTITCGGTSGNDCYADVDTGANSCTNNYVLELQEVDSNNCVAISSITISPNCFPTCTKPVLGDYATYSAAGYPLSHTMSVTGSGSDNDGTISEYTWGATSSPGVGTLTQVNDPVSSYVTASDYDASTTITYSVEDSSGAVTVCPVSDSFKTQLRPGADTGWFNYSIDINKTLSNVQNFTVTESATDEGFTMNSKFDIVTSGQYTSGTTPNICNISGVKCELSAGVVGFDETYATTASSTAKTYAITVTVPNNIAAGTYGIKISGGTTYRGLVLTDITNEKAVIISASISDISIICPSNSSCASFTSQNRGWVSGAILYRVVSMGFAGTFSISPDSSSMCGVSGATCTFSTDGTTFSSTLTSVALTANQTKDVYMQVTTTNAIPPNNYGARFIANGTRSVVGSSTGNKTSSNTAITMLNQAPVCAPIGANNYNPASPVPLRQNVTITASGGTDPDSDSLTYSVWSTSGTAISPVSGSTNSARVTMPNTYNTCYEIRYRVTDQYGAVSALPVCVVPTTLCTIVDSVPPQASITTGADSVCKGISYPVAFSYTDNDVLTDVSIMKKSPVATVATKTDLFPASTTLSGSTTFDTAGTSYVYATAKDKNNNTCDSSVTTTSCGTGTLKAITVNENADSPAMSFVTDASNPSKVRVTWTKPSTLGTSNYVFTRASGTAGTLSPITCSGNSCGVDITGLDCTASYSYNLQETDANTCKALSTITGVSPNCAPTCSTPTIANAVSVYPLNTSQTINSTKSGTNFDSEDLDAVGHIWVPSLSGTGLGGIIAAIGGIATYTTPNRNNITVQIAHSVKDSGGPNDNNFVTVSCGAVSFPMAADTLSTPVFSPGSITIARTTDNPTGSSNFTYSLANFQNGTFAIDTTNTNNASFIGNNICALTSLVTCSASTTAPVGNNQSIPLTITFNNNARVNFNTAITGGYKVLGKITYATTNASNVVVNKTAQAYYSVTIGDTAPTCTVYSRLKSTDAWADVTGKYFTYGQSTKVQVRTVGSDSDGDTIGSYLWSASAGTITPTNTQESEYTVYAVDGLNATITGRVNESAPNTLYGTCSTVMKTPDPGTHTIAAGSLNGNDTSETVAYSYSGYVNANNGIGVNGTSTISSGAIAGYINLCTVSGVTCNFENKSVGAGLTIGSGSTGSTNIIVTLSGPRPRIDNTKVYAIKVTFSAPTADGGSITASTTGGIIAITDASPTCGNISMSPADNVLSGSSGALTITALGFDDWTMSSAKLEYNSDITGTNAGTWTTIGTVSSFASVISPSAVFSWVPGSLALGRYQLRVTWTDNKSPTGNTVFCSALNSSIITTNPASPTDPNNAVVTVNGNRFSGRVLIQSDGPSNSVIYKTVSKDALSNSFVVTSNLGATSWSNLTVGPSGNPADCVSSYPDGAPDSNNCNNDFFVSNTTHLVGTSLTASVANPSSKYACTYDVWGLDASGVRVKKIANGFGCTTSPFSLETGLSSYSATTRWTTEVDFYLTYNTDQVRGFVYTNNGSNASDPLLGLSGYTISASGYVSGSSLANGSFASPDSTDSANYLPTGDRAFTITGPNIGSSASSKKCFYAFRNDGVNGSFLYQDIKNIGRVGSVPGWTTGEGCTTQALSIAHGNLSPQLQNYLYFFVVPKITVDPTSSIAFVVDCSSGVASAETLEIIPTVDLYDPSVASTNRIGEELYNATGFSIVNPSSSDPTELKWNQTYQANLLSNVNFTVCNNLSPSFTVGTASTEPNVNSTLASYPSVTSADNQVKFTFSITRKNNNDWWQVYNGGAHANGFMNLDRLPHVFVDPNVVKAPVVGKLINALATQIAPEVLYVPDLSLYYYVPALVSSFYSEDINFNDGKAGISPKIWSANQMKNAMPVPYDDKFFADVTGQGSAWVLKTNIASAFSSSNSDAVYVNSSQTHDNSSNTNKHARPIVINGDFTVQSDLLLQNSSSGPLIIIVHGNVIIDYSVATIQATIYATGTISIPTKGDQTDPILNVTGSLIADQFDFKRDLANILTNVGVPSQKINFDAKVISGTSAYPISMKQANAYWVVTD